MDAVRGDITGEAKLWVRGLLTFGSGDDGLRTGEGCLYDDDADFCRGEKA